MKNLFKFMFLLGVFLSSFAFGQVDPSNSKNVYDYIGVAHNQGLESFIKNYKNIEGLEKNKHLNPEILFNSNTMYLGKDESLLLFNSKFSKNNKLNEYFNYVTSENPDFVKALEKTNYRASNDFKIMYQDILNEVDVINFSDIKTLDLYNRNIKELEEKITKASFSTEEKEYLLAASSISRYSAVYWFKEFNSTSDWNLENEVANGSAGKQIIKMDIAGGVGGAVVGAIVGGTVTIVAGGIGAIPGWAAGAITGAVGGSITQAVFEWLDWMFG